MDNTIKYPLGEYGKTTKMKIMQNMFLISLQMFIKTATDFNTFYIYLYSFKHYFKHLNIKFKILISIDTAYNFLRRDKVPHTLSVIH